jgi:hypothetical protein
MGISGDIEHVYTLNKGQLPEDLTEAMRQPYAKASQKHLLTVVRASIRKDEVLITARGRRSRCSATQTKSWMGWGI